MSVSELIFSNTNYPYGQVRKRLVACLAETIGDIVYEHAVDKGHYFPQTCSTNLVLIFPLGDKSTEILDMHLFMKYYHS